ncbi:LacI family transcriptional regulator, partial [Xanthomonas vasicola]
MGTFPPSTSMCTAQNRCSAFGLASKPTRRLGLRCANGAGTVPVSISINDVARVAGVSKS